MFACEEERNNQVVKMLLADSRVDVNIQDKVRIYPYLLFNISKLLNIGCFNMLGGMDGLYVYFLLGKCWDSEDAFDR